MKVGSWNIDTNIFRLEGGYGKESFNNWSVKNRIPNILKYIDRQHLDIIQIQEARRCRLNDGSLVDSITPIEEGLTSMGFTVIIQPYNPTGGKCFYYIVGYKNVQYIRHYPHWFTKTPTRALERKGMSDDDIKQHNFGEFFERCCMVTEFQGEKKFICINVHMGMSYKCRMESTKVLRDLLNSFTDLFICSGDFNSFPDIGGSEQLNLLNYEDILANCSTSFVSFPYDFGKDSARLTANGVLPKIINTENETEKKERIINTFANECSALGGCLDHMFHARWQSAQGRLVFTCDHNIKINEDVVKKYILAMVKLNKPAFASDHQMVVGKFTF